MRFAIPWQLWCRAALVVGLGCAGCRTVEGPERAAAAYAQALREGRLDAAYRLTTVEFRARVGEKAFHALYAAPELRQARAKAIVSALPELKTRSSELEAICEAEGWRVAELAKDEAPRQALTQFLDAAEAADFEAAYRLLSGAWRARYSPARLAQDFAAEPLARERLARARAALVGELVWAGEEVQVPLGEGKAVRLKREGGFYKVAALE